jgi:16S rRNA (uracil1498-N3)-methyltransferase
MPRFHLPPESWHASVLTGDEARHLSQVLRIKPGESITVFDGFGRRAQAEVTEVSRDRIALCIHEAQSPPTARPSIHLAQAIPKGKNMDLIVQKAIELGVAAIHPLVTKHTIVQPGDGKSDKWRRTALEACKQCGQDTLPLISDPQPFARWIATQGEVSCLKLIASLAPGARPLRDVLQDHADTAEAILLVGPEGDFTAEETCAAITAGFIPVSLGEIVMRVETATFFCISALRYEFSR